MWWVFALIVYAATKTVFEQRVLELAFATQRDFSRTVPGDIL
jgi:hypothetical protein